MALPVNISNNWPAPEAMSHLSRSDLEAYTRDYTLVTRVERVQALLSIPKLDGLDDWTRIQEEFKRTYSEGVGSHCRCGTTLRDRFNSSRQRILKTFGHTSFAASDDETEYYTDPEEVMERYLREGTTDSVFLYEDSEEEREWEELQKQSEDEQVNSKVYEETRYHPDGQVANDLDFDALAFFQELKKLGVENPMATLPIKCNKAPLHQIRQDSLCMHCKRKFRL